MRVLGLVLCMMATVALANNGRSDLKCNYQDYSSICDCDYYKSVNCKNYYSSNGQGASYAPKNFKWDTDCANCCCIDEQQNYKTPPPTYEPYKPTYPPTESPTEGPTKISVQQRTRNPTPAPTPGGTWASGGGGGGGGKPKPKPKPKLVPPKPKPKPKPKPVESYSENSWSGGWNGSNGWNAWNQNEPVPAPVPVYKPVYVPTPAYKPVYKPFYRPGNQERPSPSRPSLPIRVPRVVTASPSKGSGRSDTAPTKPSYNTYHGEGSSYKNKSYASVRSETGKIRTAVWVGIGFLVSGIIGFAIGMNTVRRRNRARDEQGHVEMSSSVDYVRT